MNLGGQVRKIAERRKQDAYQVVRATLLDLSRRIILRTPVDTGRARGNWFSSIGKPILKYDETSLSSADAINSAAATAENAAGNVYYFTNNLPYIRRLEYEGWSKQAPSGMLRVSVIELQQALNKAIADL